MAKNKKIKRNNFIEHWGLDDDGNSILHVAAATGRLDLLQYFYLDRTHHTDINAQNFMGWTPLMQAARFGHFNCVEFLCKYVDILKKNKYGLTAISLACAHGDLKSVELLFGCMLHFGCNLHGFENPISPLTFSVLFGHTELVQFFLSKSFNINHQSIRTEITAFDCAKIIHNKQIMAFLQNSRRLSSPNKNFISSTLIDNSSTSIPSIVSPNPRISISTMPHTGSGVSGSVSSLDLSPISPVFLNNDTFSLENSPIERNNFSKKYKTPILGGSMNVPRRIKSNENFNSKSPNENSKYNTRRISTAFENTSGCVTNDTFVIEKSPTECNIISTKFVSPNSGRLGSTTATQKNTINLNEKFYRKSCSVPNNCLKSKSPIENLQRTTPNLSSAERSKKQIFFPPDFEFSNRSASNNSLKRLSLTENLQRTSPNLSSGGNRNTTPNASSTEKNKKQIFFPTDFEISNRSASNNSLKRLSPIENLQRTSPNLSSGGNRSTVPNVSSTEKNKKQTFFPNDFEISNRSASNNSLKRLSTIENLQRTSPNLSSVGNRSAHRLSPMMMDKKTNLVPVKCSSKPISPKNTCTKTVIAQKQQTTTTNYNGNIYQQVTKTYVVQQTIKSPLSINQDGNKM